METMTTTLLIVAGVVIVLFYLLFTLCVLANWRRANRYEELEDWIDDVEKHIHDRKKVRG